MTDNGIDSAWTRGGRIDSYLFAIIPLSGGPTGRISGYLHKVTSCDITMDWETSARVSGSIDVVDTSPIDSCYIRVYYVPMIAGESTHRYITLGTFYAFTQDAEYKNGSWNCTITLKSVLARYTDDRLPKHWALKKGKSALREFRTVMGTYGGSYSIDGIRDKAFTKTRIVEFGTTVYELLSKIAGTLNCAVDCDATGYVILNRKVAASKRKPLGTIPTGDRSVTLPGVSMEATWQTTPNRYATYYHDNDDDFDVFGRASVKATAKNSRAHIGRYITETEEMSKLDFSRVYNITEAFWGDGLKSKTVDYKIEELVSVTVNGKSIKATATKGKKVVTFHKTLPSLSWVNIFYTTLKPLSVRKANAQHAITQAAKDGLRSATSLTANTYTFECFYLPLRVNRVYTFRQGGLAFDGLVKSIDYALRPEGMRMTVTMRKVRSR